MTGFRNVPGVGVLGRVEGHDVEVGRRDGTITVSWDGAPRATLAVRDTVKPTSAEAIAELKRLGLTPVLLTGDGRDAAERIAGRGRHRARARRGLPGGQGRRSAPPTGRRLGGRDGRRRHQRRSRARAGGSRARDRHRHRRGDRGLGHHARLGRSACRRGCDRDSRGGRSRTIKGNLFWAFAYNVAAIPLAVAGLLSPIVAAAAMAFSSLFVVTNSLRLRRFHSMREGATT